MIVEVETNFKGGDMSLNELFGHFGENGIKVIVILLWDGKCFRVWFKTFASPLKHMSGFPLEVICFSDMK